MCNWAIWRRRIEILMEKRSMFFRDQMINKPDGPIHNEITYGSNWEEGDDQNRYRVISYGLAETGNVRLSFPPEALMRYWKYFLYDHNDEPNECFWLNRRVLLAERNNFIRMVDLRWVYSRKEWIAGIVLRWKNFTQKKKRDRAANRIRQFYFDFVLPRVYSPYSKGFKFQEWINSKYVTSSDACCNKKQRIN